MSWIKPFLRGWLLLLACVILVSASPSTWAAPPGIMPAAPSSLGLEGTEVRFSQDGQVFPEAVLFRVGGAWTGVAVSQVRLDGIPQKAKARTEGPREAGGLRVWTTDLKAGTQGTLKATTTVTDGVPGVCLAWTSKQRKNFNIGLSIIGVDRLVYRSGAGYVATTIASGSESRLETTELVLQGSGSQEGLVIRSEEPGGGFVLRFGPAGVEVVTAGVPSKECVLSIWAFRGDAMLAMEGNRTPFSRPDQSGPLMVPSQEVLVVSETVPAEAGVSSECFPTALEPEEGRTGWILWPDKGRVFSPLKADPREAIFRFGFLWNEDGDPYEDMNFGGDLGLLYKQWAPDHRLSVTVRGLFTARFDVISDSFDLLNTDFIGGIATGYQYGNDSFELLAYHQSSHLGDEPLDNKDRQRIDYARETARLLWAHQLGGLRFYAGPSFNIHALPEDIEHKWTLQTGAEYGFLIKNRPVFLATDLQSREENGWNINASFQAGVELGNPEVTKNRQYLFYEAFAGHSNMGQYWNEYEQYHMIGIGYHFTPSERFGNR